jgi:magnesium-transporting ATPase (P-type)
LRRRKRYQSQREEVIILLYLFVTIRYGKNYKRPPKIRSLFELILENFEDRILQILLIAATVALVVGIVQHGWETGWVEGLSIYIAVVIITSVTAGNNYIKEKQF